MDHMEESSGFSEKLEGQIAIFRKDLKIDMGRDRKGKPIVVIIPKGTVGTLTGGFKTGQINTKKSGKVLVTAYDICARVDQGNRRIMMILSVSIENLEMESKIEIN